MLIRARIRPSDTNVLFIYRPSLGSHLYRLMISMNRSSPRCQPSTGQTGTYPCDISIVGGLYFLAPCGGNGCAGQWVMRIILGGLYGRLQVNCDLLSYLSKLGHSCDPTSSRPHPLKFFSRVFDKVGGPSAFYALAASIGTVQVRLQAMACRNRSVPPFRHAFFLRKI